MANVKISALTAYTDPVLTDVLPIVDLVNDQTKKVKVEDLLKNFGLGSVGAPSLSFDGDSDTGIYSPGANQFAVATGGAQRFLIDASGNTTIQGNLTVNGTSTIIESTTLQVDDKNIELGVVSTPSDTTADGGGITLKGATDKTLLWVNSTDCWTFNQSLNLTAGSASAPSLILNGDVNSGIFQPGADEFAVATGGSERLKINSSGLTVANGGDLTLSDKIIHAGDTNTAIRFPAADTVSVETAGIERFRVTSSGNFGIGDSNPDQKLIVSGSGETNAKLSGAASTVGGYLYLQNTNTTDNNSMVIEGVDAQGQGTSQVQFINVSHTNNEGAIAFNTRPSGGSMAQRIRIDSSGNLGVGTTSPSYKIDAYRSGSGIVSRFGKETIYGEFHVSGEAVGFQGTRSSDSAVTGFFINNPGNTGTSNFDNVSIKTAGTEKFKILSDGQIYHYLYDRWFASNGTTTVGYVGRANQMTAGGSDTDFSIASAANNLTFVTNGGERLRIDSDGHLMIGTTTKGFNNVADQFTIANSSHCGMTIRSGSTSSSSIYFADGTSGAAEYDGYIDYSHNDQHLRFGTAGGTERLRIDSSGRILVGTSVSRIVEDHVGNGPQGKIQIEATNSDAIMSIISAGTADANRCGTLSLGRHRNSTVGGTPTIVQNGDSLGALIFSAGDGTDMRTAGAKITASVDGTPGSNDMPGRLMFATTADGSANATERLRILSDGTITTAGLAATPGTVAAGSIVNANANAGFFTSGYDGKFGSATNHPVYLQVNGSAKLGIDTSGNATFDLAVTAAGTVKGNSGYVAGRIGAEFYGNSTSGTYPALVAQNFQSGVAFQGKNNAGTATTQLMANGSAQFATGSFLIESSGNSYTAGFIRGDSTGAFDGSNDKFILNPTSGTIQAGPINISSSTGYGVVNDVTANAGMIYAQCQGTASQYTGLYNAYFGSTQTFHVLANGNVANTNNSYGAISDIKLKENIVDANSQWDDIKGIRVRNYNFIEGQTHTQIGVIAQEIETISPGLVNEVPDTDTEGKDLGTTTKSVSYSVLYMKAIKALQEAMERIEALETEVATLKGS